MRRTTRGRCLVILAVSLITALMLAGSADAGLFDWLRPKKAPAGPPRQSMVIFPFDAGVQGLPEGFGEQVAHYLRTTMAENDKYMVIVFRDRLAPIQRAKDDTTLKTADWTPPFAEDREKPLKLARILAADLFLVGTIEDFQFDAARKTAQLTLSATIYDAVSGRLVGQYLVTGSVDETAKAADVNEYRAIAAGKAVEALKERILPPPPPPAENASEEAPGAPGSPEPAPAQ